MIADLAASRRSRFISVFDTLWRACFCRPVFLLRSCQKGGGYGMIKSVKYKEDMP